MQLGFYLKKVIGMLLPKISRGLIAVAGVLLALTSWQPVSDGLIRPFEEDYPQFNLEQPVAGVVVLGGCHSTVDILPALKDRDSYA